MSRFPSFLTRFARAALAAVGLMTTVIVFAPPAAAVSEEEWRSCARAGGNSVDLPIRGCTAVIDAGRQFLEKLVAAYNNRGVAFRSNGEIDRAIEDYDQAIALKPDYYVAINNRGVALMNKGELDRAIADFDRAVQIKPDYHPAFYSRAVAYGRKGHFGRAIADYDVVIRVDPKNAALLHQRGALKLKSGDATGGEADIRRAESIKPGIAAEMTRAQ